MAENLRVVFVSAPDPGSAEKIAAELVASKLAACVNIVPGVVSHYVWEGKQYRNAELLLLVKTRESLLPVVTRFVRERHPAKLPEIIALAIQGGDRQYLDWVASATQNAQPL